MTRPILFLLLAAACGSLTGCDRAPEHKSEAHAPEAPTPTNRVDINPTVRQNLGITFASVESRDVARTLRIPGRFELKPTAKREYRVAASGTIELLVEQYQRVEPGTPLYRLDSPRWRELQRELADADAGVTLAQAAADSIAPFMDAHEKHHTEIQRAVALWTERVSALEELRAAGGASIDELSQARASLATARTDLAETLEKEAELTARRQEVDAELAASKARAASLLATAASLTGVSSDRLGSSDTGVPHWQTIDAIEVPALSSGVIDSVHAVSGTFVEPSALVVSTVQPTEVRFRAHALQSDFGRLADGLPAAVVAPQGGSLGATECVKGTLTVAPTADPERRTIELAMTPDRDAPVPSWARAGVSAFLEVGVAGTGREELAIPLACVARDGTESIIFRRDPANPNSAIRMEADLGIDDGRWIVIKSGVAEGNEIVLDGVYQLMVATSGSITKGGHFHPDGTFHDGEH